MPLPSVRETYFEDVGVGQEIPSVSIGPLTHRDFIYVPSAHHIWYAGHFDEEFARAQGMPDMFMHGYFYYAMWQRLLCGWGGANSVPRRVKYRITHPTIRGHHITATGRVTGKRVENGEHLVELDITMITQEGQTNCMGNATVVLASREPEREMSPPRLSSIPIGDTAPEYRQYIGRETEPRAQPYPIEWRAVEHYLEGMQDDNPLYWSDEYASQTRWGRRIAPWGAGNELGMKAHDQWRPSWMEQEAKFRSVMEGIPGFPTEQMANTDTEYWCFAPVYIGDRLYVTTRLAAIIGPKTTKLGTGYFVWTEGIYRNQRGEVCIKDDMAVYNYHSGTAAATGSKK